VRNRKAARGLALALALTALLAVATPAGAEAPTWTGSWLAGQLDGLGCWWGSLLGVGERTTTAANESAPTVDPNGPAVEPAEPGSNTLSGEEGSAGESDSAPTIDPNG
jgi:hypothetical protein